METFVIRVWSPASPGTPPIPGLRRPHGLIEHVASGRSSTFRGLDELAALILTQLDWPGPNEGDPGARLVSPDDGVGSAT
jgi:hypothetical protein